MSISDAVPRSDPPGASQPTSATAGDLSLVAIVNTLLQQRRLLLAVATASAVLTALILLVLPRTFSVSPSFIVQSNDRSAAASLATQLGVPVGLADVSQSPAFYAALVKTPDVLGRLIDTTFTTSRDATPRPLAEIWDVSPRDPKLRREAVLQLLQRAITSSVGLKIDLISVTVTTRDALLSKNLADAMLAEVNRFNLVTRQSRASAERKFTEARMAQVQTELHAAEDALQRFYQDNRQPQLSAALEIEKARIARKIDVVQTTYMTLAAAYERARIDEVRDTPLITIVQRAESPVRADARGVASKTLLMFVLGFLGACVFAVARESVDLVRKSQDDTSLEFDRLLAATSHDLRNVRGTLRRLARRGDRADQASE